MVRIAAWQARLAAVSDAPRFWSASLDADAWATARLLRGWYDRLVDAGWNPQLGYVQSRLRNLAATDTAQAGLPPDRKDRFARAVEAATGTPCDEWWLHQAVVGRAARVTVR